MLEQIFYSMQSYIIKSNRLQSQLIKLTEYERKISIYLRTKILNVMAKGYQLNENIQNKNITFVLKMGQILN